MKHLLILLVLTGLTLYSISSVYDEYQSRKDLSKVGQITTASVTKIRREVSRRGGGGKYVKKWQIYYTFELPSYPGIVFSNVEKVDDPTYEKIKGNSETIITYKKNNPSQSYIGNILKVPRTGVVGLTEVLWVVLFYPLATMYLLYRIFQDKCNSLMVKWSIKEANNKDLKDTTSGEIAETIKDSINTGYQRMSFPIRPLLIILLGFIIIFLY